jgi:diguanylate cyclase (GGDEF)-like protein/PAS domain S-box-containing protein
LSERGRVRGALKVYADEEDYFDPELVALLQELAANISFSLDNFLLQEEKDRAEMEWRESQERLQTVMEASNLGMWEWEIREGSFTFSPQLARLLGYDPEDVAGDTVKLYDLIHPDDGARAKRSLQEIFNRRSEEFSLQMRVLKKSKEWEWILCQGKVVAREAGKAVRVAGIASCITDQKKYQEKLEYESTHDAMTGLYNRSYFDKKLTQIAETGAVPTSIIVADLDRLKEVNDAWGHAEGDRMIRQAAKLLQQVCRAEDIVARVGGDEFAVILPETNAEVVELVVLRLEEAFAKVDQEAGGPCLSVSFGADTAWATERIGDSLELADARMYNNKLKKKG